MPEYSKRRKKELEAARSTGKLQGPSLACKFTGQYPDRAESARPAKQDVFNWVRKHKITTFIGGLFAFSLGGPLNFFGSDPRIFYFPAVVLCIGICWIVMSGTHKFVQRRLSDVASPIVQLATETALTVFPYAYPSHKQPFDTDFVLENRGSVAVRNVACDFVAKSVKMHDREIYRDDHFGGLTIKEVHAGGQATLHCSSFHMIIIPDKELQYAELEIVVTL